MLPIENFEKYFMAHQYMFKIFYDLPQKPSSLKSQVLATLYLYTIYKCFIKGLNVTIKKCPLQMLFFQQKFKLTLQYSKEVCMRVVEKIFN